MDAHVTLCCVVLVARFVFSHNESEGVRDRAEQLVLECRAVGLEWMKKLADKIQEAAGDVAASRQYRGICVEICSFVQLTYFQDSQTLSLNS